MARGSAGRERKTWTLEDKRSRASGVLTPRRSDPILIFLCPILAEENPVKGGLRTALVRLVRDSRVIYEGKLSSLKRFKDDVKEVQHGFECGIGIENYNDLKVGDVIEAFQKEQVEPS